MPEERKLVTILFADVTGSTSLGDSFDPEDVRALMNRYYTHARGIMPIYGGTLEKFIGDAVMVVFGLPLAHSDDAERALAAALALRQAVAEDEMLGPLFQLCIGINTGEVVSTSDHSGDDFLVTGDAVNTSARLQQNANPGEILVGERTFSAAQHAFLFSDGRLVKVKGKPHPLRAFTLLQARASRLVEHPPLIGREQDLWQLSLLWQRTLAEQRPQLVSVIAPAGIGKTRLLEEFLHKLEAPGPVCLAVARCQPYGQTHSYTPLRSLLGGLLADECPTTLDATIEGSTSAFPPLAQLIQRFEQGDYSTADATHLADLLLSSLDPESEQQPDRESMFTAWRLFIEACAWHSPHLLLFEDIHWASDELLDLIEYITHLRTCAQLLFVALSRPELLHRRPNWGAGRQNLTALALQPLNLHQTQHLVAHKLNSPPTERHEQVAKRSGGNPFFALELIRCLSEGEPLISVLPDTVHASIQARLDQLNKAERAVLQVASVAGQSFQKSMLADTLSDYSLKEIDSALDGLLAHDLLLSQKGGKFTFQQDLVRDVAYATLSRPERIRLHEQIASWLEMIAADHLDDSIEPIAYHYREIVSLARQSAVRASPSFDVVRALYFLQRAVEQKSDNSPFAEAYHALQQMKDGSRSGPERRIEEGKRKTSSLSSN